MLDKAGKNEEKQFLKAVLGMIANRRQQGIPKH